MASKGKTVRESSLKRKQVNIAVNALLNHVKENQSKKTSLLGDEQSLWLIMALKKVPAPDRKPKRIPLNNSLLPDDTEVCLITKREGKLAKELLKSAGVTSVKKVISLAKLKKNYKSYESKRQLASLYDVFVCDDTIYHLLPRVLGKAFFSRKKFPIPVDLKKKDLNRELNKILKSTYMSLGQGPCSAIRIGHTGQNTGEVVANIIEATKHIASIVPRGWKNIKSLNIKTSDSISLPIHNSLPDIPTTVNTGQTDNKQEKIPVTEETNTEQTDITSGKKKEKKGTRGKRQKIIEKIESE